MANLLPEGRQSFETAAGIPLVGGKVYTYDAGTLTPRLTYADPVILDSRGEATIFWSGGYKVILKDSLDNTIWTVDQILQGGSFGNLTVTGNTVLGDQAADTLTISSNAVTWSNNPTHSGNHTFSGNLGFGDALADTIAIGGVAWKSATGNYTFAAPSAGITVSAASVGANAAFSALASSSSGKVAFDGSDINVSFNNWFGGGSEIAGIVGSLGLGTTGAFALNLITNSVVRQSISSAGNHTFVAPSAGVGVTATGFAGSNAANINGGTSGTFSVTTTGGATTNENIRATGASSTIGYGTGAGGAATQATSKSTNVTLDKAVGKITMNAAALGAGASVSFVHLNSVYGVNDIYIPQIEFNASDYSIRVFQVIAGQILLSLKNETAGSLSEAVRINFAIIKGANS
jgi:hypothetical protein